jgi:uroporphyrinogen decarboxylase
MGLFKDRLKNQEGKTQVPVWFMRQAGRYHSHYQNIKKDSDFMTMCKTPKLADEITMGPIDCFDFDAAILFSDLLFPLEQLDLGLSYKSGPPTLEVKLSSLEDIKGLKKQAPAREFYNFQKEACKLLRNNLPKEKTLLGFVGGPFTLYSYACEGSHQGNLTDSKKGLYDGRFHAFMELLLPELIENMIVQAEGGADALCLFDTAVGELSFKDFKKYALPVLRTVTKEFKKIYPDKNIIYYSKLTHMHYLKEIQDENIDVLGIDWRMDLKEALTTLGKDYYIQGNFDPSYLHLPWPQVEENLQEFFANINHPEVPLDKWICGLGHGVLQHTPEENVKNAISYIHKNFIY